MRIEHFLLLYIGVAAVLQAGFNKEIAKYWGYGGAVFFNSIVLCIASLILIIVVQMLPSQSSGLIQELKPKWDLSKFSLWFIIPGIMGMSIVLGVPLAISKLGAVKVTVGVIGAQLLASLLWDVYAEGMPVQFTRVLGVTLAFLGALVSLYPTKS